MEPPSKSEASVLSLPDKDEAHAEEEKRKEQEEADAQEEKKKEQEEADAEEEKKKEQEEADAKKKCPGSGNACTGNECCPGYAGSNGFTFPCPDADSTYVGCESMDRQSLAQTTKMEPPSKSEASVLSLPDKDEANAEEEKRKE